MADIQMYVGNTLPALADTFTVDDDGTPYVFPTGATLTFSMRPVESTVLKITAAPATIVDAANGKIRYDWDVADVDTAGEFVAWWTVTTGGKSQDSPDITISFGTHGEVVDDTSTFTWPTREFLVATSTMDWSEVSQDQFIHWARGARADMIYETGRDRAWFYALPGDGMEAQYAREIWQMLMDQRLVMRRDDVQESLYDTTYQSFTAGSYSETKPQHQAPARGTGKVQIFPFLINSAPEIARKLWALMTDAKKDEIRALSGEVVPAEYILETDWFDDPYGGDRIYPWWTG